MKISDELRAALQDRIVIAVADATGVNRVTVGNIKTGKQLEASKSTVKALEAYLGVSND